MEDEQDEPCEHMQNIFKVVKDIVENSRNPLEQLHYYFLTCETILTTLVESHHDREGLEVDLVIAFEFPELHGDDPAVLKTIKDKKALKLIKNAEKAIKERLENNGK